jgi:hypothetical protein
LSVARSVGVLPDDDDGEDGDEPPLPHEENNADSAAAVAAVHAPAQNERRETFVSTQVSLAISGPAETLRIVLAEDGARCEFVS